MASTLMASIGFGDPPSVGAAELMTRVRRHSQHQVRSHLSPSMRRSPLRSLAMPLMMTLVLGAPRFIHGTSNETGGWTGYYETSGTASNPSVSERTPVHPPSSPADEPDDPYEDGASDSPDSLISP
jgi:hypothetical protein